MAPTTFPELLDATVRARADQPALVAGKETLTYAELERRTGRTARALLVAGVGKGTRVALLASDGTLSLTTFYACLRLGALVTLVSTLTTPPELAHVLRTSDAQLLIGVRRFLRRDYAETLEAALPELAEAGPAPLWLLSAPHLRSVWLDDAEGVRWAVPLEEALSRADAPGAPDDGLLAAVEREVSPADDAFVVYTSGSTALPKAVVHSQASVVSQPAALAPLFRMTPDDRVLSLLPSFWLGGVAAALQVLVTGSTLLYPASPSEDDVLDTIGRTDPTYAVVWHAQRRLRAAAKDRGMDLRGIRGLGSWPADQDGQRIPAGLRANLLGMSESFSAHSGEPVDVRMPEAKRGSSGRPVNGIERRVVHPETGEPLGPGEVGELQLRGGALMTGLYKVPREQVFTPDGFYPTKDLVRVDEDDYLWFVGRTGDMIKTNSANVSRLEVEAALNALPDVELALVVGLADPEIGEVVASAVVPAPGASPTEDDLRTQLRGRLSSFKIPRRFVFIDDDDVPRTTTGKVRLTDLADLVAAHLPDQAAVSGPGVEAHSGPHRHEEQDA